MGNTRVCSVQGCDKPTRIRDLCPAHYMRLKRNGDAKAGRTAKGVPMDWINAHLQHTDATQCLIWPFATEKSGYALARVGGKNVRVHRYICTIVKGSQPSEHHDAFHICGNGHAGCVNPNHVCWELRAENQTHRILRDTDNRAKLTEAEVLKIRALGDRMTHAELAKMFNVSVPTISRVQRRKAWAWLD